MVTLRQLSPHSVLWGVRKGFQARLDDRKPGRPSGGTPAGEPKAVYEDPRTGFGSIAQTLHRLRCATPASPERRAFLDGLRVNQDRPLWSP